MANDEVNPTTTSPTASEPSETVPARGPQALGELLTSTERVPSPAVGAQPDAQSPTTESAAPALAAEAAPVAGSAAPALGAEAAPVATSAAPALGAEAAPLAVSAELPPALPPAPGVDWNERQIKWMSRVVLAVLVVAVLVLVGARLSRPVDLAAGKPWRTSSKWIDCDPNIGRCGSHVTLVLFHTNEDESPWFEIDLQQPTAFSSVTVVNRSDFMPERAVPLILEVSDDQATWTELARRNEVFSRWSPSFPKVTKRFVRVRVPRRTFLHLEGVQVHP